MRSIRGVDIDPQSGFYGAMEIIDRRRLGAYDAAVRDIRHVRIFHDPNRYAGHVNRGGIWNFGDGELVVAHRVKTVDYRNADWLAAGAHDFSHLPAGATSGIMPQPVTRRRGDVAGEREGVDLEQTSGRRTSSWSGYAPASRISASGSTFPRPMRSCTSHLPASTSAGRWAGPYGRNWGLTTASISARDPSSICPASACAAGIGAARGSGIRRSSRGRRSRPTRAFWPPT